MCIIYSHSVSVVTHRVTESHEAFFDARLLKNKKPIDEEVNKKK